MKKKALCLVTFLLLSLGLVACDAEEEGVLAPVDHTAVAVQTIG